ncbi:hypothetical protein HSACCH_00579 [Halanaerobium saccharolyticum subsp. saccharolyticum DSM 6643]|uniref:Uncharacterized protein n=1 Tax=Halanaerobium saccharolyticum subsp. saccharolyticum DSM 6643 TaxID=1293054 RepID=M5DZ06_9FIRM|nr:hypothetical protein HSACCH_00579 [Halanaerobium saccharolyticum subsp. saccharolyticum DSM 6643]
MIFGFNSQPPTKGTAIRTDDEGFEVRKQFQFSAPNKGDCNWKLL